MNLRTALFVFIFKLHEIVVTAHDEDAADDKTRQEPDREATRPEALLR
jgi:hypothetical protein